MSFYEKYDLEIAHFIQKLWMALKTKVDPKLPRNTLSWKTKTKPKPTKSKKQTKKVIHSCIVCSKSDLSQFSHRPWW